jgi:hypothetical protein
MAANLKDILTNTKDLYMTDSALSSLLDFEQVLDEIDLYTFKHWKKGELVEGPINEKYFITCTFMWPYKLMPDPRGGERLLDYGCEVRFKRDWLESPVKIKDPDDYQGGTKYPKMAKNRIWLVEIIIPKQLIKDINQGSIELENDTIDIEDIDKAYETNADQDENLTPDAQQGEDTDAQAMTPEQQPGGGL